MNMKSNYECFKQAALRRFLTYEQPQLIDRLTLQADDTYIYVELFSKTYRIHRKLPCIERYDTADERSIVWKMADPNETLTICDLLCHSASPVILKGDYVSLPGLNRVKGGSTSTILGGDHFSKTAALFDGKDDLLSEACLALGGTKAGKGDVAYEIPLHGQIHVRLSFYHSDEDFPPVITLLFKENICEFLYYETLYYAANILLHHLSEYVACGR